MIARRDVNHLMLDNEAVAALLGRASARKRSAVAAMLEATEGRRAVPTPVRVEAGWRRADPEAAGADRAVAEDVVLDGAMAERAVTLRRAVLGASVVDASVIVAAEHVGRDGSPVVVLTSDVDDVKELAAHADASVKVVPV